MRDSAAFRPRLVAPLQTGDAVPDLADLRSGLQMTKIRAPLAPGLFVAFGQWRGAPGFPEPVSALATGKGLTEAAAEAGCLGEMAENLSIGRGAHSGPVAAGSWPDARALDLADPQDPGSEGCAAHPDAQEARVRALCERVERAALALWWLGLPDVTAWRGTDGPRETALWLLDPGFGLPVVLALTQDRRGGWPVIGTAAAPDRAAAVSAALSEVMLAEVALLAPPAHPDHQRLLRQGGGLMARLPGLLAAPPAPPPGPPADPARIIAALQRAGHSADFADLTCPAVGVAVFRCLCRGLPSARALGL
jgi:hypothetical protein